MIKCQHGADYPHPCSPDPDSDWCDGRVALAVAQDLYRDVRQIAWQVARLRSSGIGDSLCIIAPARDGQLRGGLFLGLPIVEAEVSHCLVAVGYQQRRVQE